MRTQVLKGEWFEWNYPALPIKSMYIGTIAYDDLRLVYPNFKLFPTDTCEFIVQGQWANYKFIYNRSFSQGSIAGGAHIHEFKTVQGAFTIRIIK